MAGLKIIKRRLASVKNTKKITYAMKLVSAAKLRKAQEAVTASRAYSDALSNLLRQLQAEQGDDAAHALMQSRENTKKIALLVIGGGRGLCGGYNTNINRRIEQFISEQRQRSPLPQVESIVLGRKPAEFYRRSGLTYAKALEQLSEDPNTWPLAELVNEITEQFTNTQYDEVHLIYTRFRSALSQTVVCERILPMTTSASAVDSVTNNVRSGSTIFEPSVTELFNELLPRILRARVQQAALDSKASEHGSRMTAMDAATKNAGDIIDKLRLTYNKLRQSGITAELLDIIGGANAVN